MTLCRSFGILDPGKLRRHPDYTPLVRERWIKYYEQTAMHPLAVPMAIGINTYNVRASASKDNVKGLKPENFVPYMPDKRKVDFSDAQKVKGIFGKK